MCKCYLRLMLKRTPLYGLPTCVPWFKTDIFYVYLSVCITIYLTTCLSVLSPPLYIHLPFVTLSAFQSVVCLSRTDCLIDYLSVRVVPLELSFTIYAVIYYVSICLCSHLPIFLSDVAIRYIFTLRIPKSYPLIFFTFSPVPGTQSQPQRTVCC